MKGRESKACIMCDQTHENCVCQGGPMFTSNSQTKFWKALSGLEKVVHKRELEVKVGDGVATELVCNTCGANEKGCKCPADQQQWLVTVGGIKTTPIKELRPSKVYVLRLPEGTYDKDAIDFAKRNIREALSRAFGEEVTVIALTDDVDLEPLVDDAIGGLVDRIALIEGQIRREGNNMSSYRRGESFLFDEEDMLSNDVRLWAPEVYAKALAESYQIDDEREKRAQEEETLKGRMRKKQQNREW